MEFSHKSVLLDECIENLNIKENGLYVDGTLGGGGHSYHILKNLNGTGMLYGVDQDGDAIKAASERLQEYSNKTIIRNNYRNAVSELKSRGVQGVDGILLDLGVSSYQLDEPERGFTYKVDAKLDMRMDTRQELTARDIVNQYSENDIFRIIRDYGEDKFAKNIAKHIVNYRNNKPIETTFELNEIIKNAIPAKMRANGGHPSKRTYQAIRIECNKELEVLENSIDEMIEFLNPGGRFCIITFHSLEDRIVKNTFRDWTMPVGDPRLPDLQPAKFTLIKTQTPTDDELIKNSRARSAHMRAVEKSY